MIEPLSFPRPSWGAWLVRALVLCLVLMSAYLVTQTAAALFDIVAERIEERAPAPRPTALPAAEATAAPTATLAATATPERAETALPTEGPVPGCAPTEDTISLPDRIAMAFAGDTPTPTLPPTPTETPVPTATPERGTVRAGPVDEQKMIYIPAGKFRMGNPVHDGQIVSDTQPEHKVVIGDFWMGRVPVTNAMYATCVEAGGCTKPIREELNPHYYDPDYAKHPVVYVVWEQAAAYCTWAGGRLPSEAEWEWAARANRESRSFAWRGDPNPEIANLDNYRDSTVAVGRFPENASPFGVLDMGSNVREWVNDWYGSRYYSKSPDSDPTGPAKGEKKVLRGAAWHDPVEYAFVTRRYAHVPGSPGANRGFRCAFD